MANQTIRGYELYETIGKGGFGAVYRAYQPVLQREVAIKVILPQHANQPDFIRSFETEAQLVARLEHPHIVPLFDYWQEAEGAFLVMRLVRGGSLTGSLKQGVWSSERALHLLDQISSALALAHRAGVIHRDIKPDNILLDEENAYLTDFGIAQLMAKPERSNSVSGSLLYIAPEQLLGGDPIPQSDIYALALVMYEVLAGEHVFKDATVSELINNHLRQPIPNITAKLTDVPDAVNSVLQRATSKDPFDRYSTVRDFYKAFQHAFVPIPVGQVELPDDAELVNPYKGLRAFEQADAHDYYGREILVAKLGQRLAEDNAQANFLAVVGASGSGKSSVVKAGLIPALRKDLLPGSSRWIVVEMTPSAHPLQNLAGALEGLTLEPLTTLVSALSHDKNALLKAGQRIFETLQAELLIVIDQFEEVFTLCQDESERTQFLDLIAHAILAPRFNLRVVVTLRADFYDRPLSYRTIGELFQARTQVVLPMSAEEIERAIRLPAQQVGALIDSDLIARLVSDVQNEAGGLPLLQYALTELFERREGRKMTLSTYQASGGVTGALARRADEVWQELPPHERILAQQLFLRLITLGEGTEDTRRRAKRSELLALGDAHTLNSILDAFGKYRLLTFDYELGTREPTVEVAHEALIRTWERLHQWLDDSRNDIRLERQLASAWQEWDIANQDASYLLSGSRLAQFDEWANTTNLALTTSEREYLQASLDEQRAKRAQDEARKAYEQRLEQRNRTALRVLVGVFGLAAILAIGLSGFAFTQRQEALDARTTSEANAILAENARATSDANAVIANSQRWASESNVQLGSDFQLASLLAVRSLTTQYTTTGDNALQNTLEGLTRMRKYPASEEAPPAISSDKQQLAISQKDHSILVVDVLTYDAGDTTAVLPTLSGAESPLTLLAWSSDDQFILSNEQNNVVRVWDVANAKELIQFDAPEDVQSLEMSPDNRFVLAKLKSDVTYWQVDNGQVGTYLQGLSVITPSFAPTGATVLAVDSTAQVPVYYTVDLDTGERVERAFNSQYGQYSSDQTRLFLAQDARFAIFSTTTWQEERGFTVQTTSTHFVVSPNDQIVVYDVSDGFIQRWNIQSGTALGQISAQESAIENMRFSSDSSMLLTSGIDGQLSLSDVNIQRPLRTYAGYNHARFEFTLNDEFALVLDGNTPYLIDTRKDVQSTAVHIFGNEKIQVTDAHILADGNYAVFDDQGNGYVQNGDNGELIAQLKLKNGARLNAFVPTDGTQVWYTDGQAVNIYTVADKTERTLSLGTGVKGTTATYSGIAVSLDQQTLFLGKVDGSVDVWNLADTTLTQTLNVYTPASNTLYSYAPHLSQDGRYLLFLTRDGDKDLVVLDTTTLTVVTTLTCGEDHVVKDATIDRHNQMMVLCDGQLWRQTIGDHTPTSQTISADYARLAVSNDGKRVAFGTIQGGIVLYASDDLTTVSRQMPNVHRSPITTLEFFTDDTRLLSASGDGFTTYTPVTYDQLIDFVCARLFRDFTDDERELYDIPDRVPTCRTFGTVKIVLNENKYRPNSQPQNGQLQQQPNGQAQQDILTPALQDSFDDNHNQWLEIEDNLRQCRVDGGVFKIATTDGTPCVTVLGYQNNDVPLDLTSPYEFHVMLRNVVTNGKAGGFAFYYNANADLTVYNLVTVETNGTLKIVNEAGAMLLFTTVPRFTLNPQTSYMVQVNLSPRGFIISLDNQELLNSAFPIINGRMGFGTAKGVLSAEFDDFTLTELPKPKGQ